VTENRLAQFHLDERQMAAIRHLKEYRQIGNTDYQKIFKVAKRTAARDLAQLAELGLVERVGTTGKGTYYVLTKGATKEPKEPRR
jgi:ATP-dependent DNA helicase RecG